MNEKENQITKMKIDGVQAIFDYTRCKEFRECEDCECSKQINIENFNNLCEFLRTFTATARNKIDSAFPNGKIILRFPNIFSDSRAPYRKARQDIAAEAETRSGR